jgi:hypothetical protein
MIRSPIPLVPFSPITLTYQADDTFAQSSAKRRLGNQAGLLAVVGAVNNSFDFSYDIRYLLKE